LKKSTPETIIPEIELQSHQSQHEPETPVQHEQKTYTDYESFYAAYYNTVFGYMRQKVSRQEDAEDLTAKVFLYCFEKWDTFDATRASQKTWLFMIVRSRWIDFLRRNRPDRGMKELDESFPGENEPLEQAAYLEALRDDLAWALESLGEQQKRAIILRYFGNRGNEEIASLLSVSESNVRVLIHRGLKKLESMMKLRGYLVYDF